MHGIRALDGVIPDEAAVARFDAEHAAWLEHNAPERFGIRHRIDAHLLQPLR
jgi:hypothetical protein